MTSGRLLLAILTLVWVCLPYTSAQTRRRSDPKKASEACAPWSYTRVSEGVEGIGHGWKEEEIIQGLLRCKVDFPATDGVKDDLRKKGASDKVIEALVQVAPPPPPDPTPKKIPKGALSIHCAPVDCDVSLNGQAAGSSQNGEISLPDLRIGDVVIDFSSKGYITQQKSVRIVADSAVPVAVTLEPDSSTKAEFGRKILQSSLAELGLAKDRKQLWTLAATGSATSWDSDGKDSEWSVEFAFGAPNLLRIVAHGPAGNLTLLCRGENCVPKKKGSLLGGKHAKAPALDGLIANLMLFARWHLAAMLDQLTTPSNHFSSPSFDASAQQDQHVAVETTDTLFDITIGRQFLLGPIVWNPKSGLGAGLTIIFGSYLKFSDFQYPSHTDIKLPGAGQHGIQIRLDSIRQELNLPEKDFPPQ